MSYNAKIYKVFSASPDDVQNEREIVCSVIMRWNAINAESKHIVLLPVGWETHTVSETVQRHKTIRTSKKYVKKRC